MRARIFALAPFGLLAAALLSGCGASAKESIDKQFDALHAEIAKVQSEQDRLNERIGGLEAANRAKTPGKDGERPPLKVVVLQPDAAEPAPDPEPEDTGERPVVSARGRGDVGSAQKGKAGATKSADADKEYETALGLVKKKQYGRAVEALTGFLVRYPDHAHADNAMFWMGEAYLGQGDTARALEQLEAVVARFPQGNKAPDALLKIAILRRKAGDDAKAREALAELRRKYPTSDAAKRAPKE